MGDQEINEDLHSEEQSADGRFSFTAIYNYLRYQKYPEGASKLEKNSLRRRSKYFMLQNEDLYYIGGGKAASSTPRLVVENTEQRKRIIASIHDASHLGLNRTNDMVASKYYWPGLFMDVRTYVESCDRCQCGNKKLKKAVGGLHPIPVKPSLFWQLGMDMIGPLPETPRGNKYVVARFIYSVICRFGSPETLITDQGREFVNELSAELYAITNTDDHRITSAYHPQTNRLTERFNQTLSQCLAKVCNEDQTNWDEKLDTVLMGYRASRQASTKHSPYYMLFQQHMRLPIDAEVLSPSNAPDENAPNVDTAVQALIKSREKVFKKADSNILSAQKKQKETYDRKHQPDEIAVGTEVLLENTAQKQRKGGKLEPAWLGPYVINRCIGKGLYELSRDGKVVKKKANIARLKIYVKRANEGDILTSGPAAKKSKASEYWVRDLILTRKDKVILEKGKILSDVHMNAAQKLLGEQFPQLQSLQSTLLSQTSSFEPVSECGGFYPEAIQILFVPERQHWVATAYHDGEVHIYDSCFPGYLCPSTEEQLVRLYRPAVREGAYHCAMGDDFEGVTIEQNAMRKHLLECFEHRQLSAFPIALGPVNRNPAKHLFVHVHCICQLPESYDSNMIQCDKCSLWHHFKCMNLHSDSTVPDTWYCSTCN